MLLLYMSSFLLCPANLIDCASQHGALARGPLQPLTGGRECGQAHAPPIEVASGPQTAPPMLLGPGAAWPPDSLRPVIFMVLLDCSGQAQPTGGLLLHFHLSLCPRQTPGACAVQLEKQI